MSLLNMDRNRNTPTCDVRAHIFGTRRTELPWSVLKTQNNEMARKSGSFTSNFTLEGG